MGHGIAGFQAILLQKVAISASQELRWQAQ